MKEYSKISIFKRPITTLMIVFMLLSSIGFNYKSIYAEDEATEEETVEVSEESNETTTVESEEEIEETYNEEIIYQDGNLSFDNDEYNITLTYTKEAKIPQDASLLVEEIKDDSNKYNNYVENAANELFNNEDFIDNSIPYARFFDITILSKDNEVIEPSSNVTVEINLKDDVLNTEDVEFTGLHFKEEDNNIVNTEIIDINTEEVVSFETDSFSVFGVVYYYTVDFYYQNNEYHMNGGSEMLLSELFNKLSIDKNTSDITNVEFTNNDLLTITKQDNDYLIKSLQAFTTYETLTITFNDDEVIVINVEDEIASGIFGRNDSVKWSIDDEGHFILEPATEGVLGQIPYSYGSATSKGGSTPRAGSRLWPWEAYKDKIVTAEIKGEVGTYGNQAFAGMFEWCDNLISVDVSGLNVGRVNSVTYFFANCPKLKTITGLNEWANSKHRQDGNPLDGSVVGTKAITNVASMFRECPSLEEIDLSAWTSEGKMKNFQNMCTGCTSLKKFTLNNSDFKTDPASQWHTGSNGPFKDCKSLETVEMSNITISTNNNGLKDLFTGLSSLKEVTMKDIDFKGVTSMENMFNNCQNLETLTFSPKEGAAFTEESNMSNLFSNCPKLKTLDLTNLDNSAMTYSHQLGFEDLDSLTTLKADNSKIWIAKNGVNTNSLSMENINMVRDIDFIQNAVFNYSPNPKDSDYSGSTPIEVDTAEIVELVVKDGTSKDTIGYTNTNNAGLLSPGTYERTSSIDETDMEVPLTYYVIDGMDNNTPTIEFYINGKWEKWDNTSASVNDRNYHEDDMGGYHVFTYPANGSYDTRIFTKALTNQEWENGTNTSTDSYDYRQVGGPIRITYPNSATSINGTKHDVVITINRITFEDMSRIPNVTDEKYTTYDSDFNEVEIDNPWGPDSHRPDKWKIPGNESTSDDYNNKKTRRYVLNASIGELRFWNQITKENISQDTNSFTLGDRDKLISKGSGTYIDFNLNISGAEDGQSVLYWCDDLDMPENESWTMDPVNPDADVRDAVNYAPGAEGIVLGAGNDLSSVTLANRTYLDLYNYADGSKKDAVETEGNIKDNNDVTTTGVANYIIGSRPDPETLKTRFYVKSNAKGSNYIWTTGTSCETTVLKSTSFKRFDILDNRVDVSAQKQINGEDVPEALDRTFDFVLEPVKKADMPTVKAKVMEGGELVDKDFTNNAEAAFPDKVNVKNIGNDDPNINFGEMTFLAPGANFVDTGKNDPIYWLYRVYTDSNNKNFYYRNGNSYSWTETIIKETIQDTDEYGNPLFDGDGNPIMIDKETIQYNEISYTPCIETVKAYVFKIYEKQGTEPYITDWDGTEYYLKVITFAPSTDEEMEKGSKLEVTIGTKNEGETEIAWDVTTTKYGADTKDNPYAVKVGIFNNEAEEVELPAGTINVQKEIDGRTFRSSDKFHFALLTEENATPLPTGSREKDGTRFSDITIDTSDTKIDDYKYKDSSGFNTITFTGAHMVDNNGVAVNEKTFTYHIREEQPAEAGDNIPGISYSTERYTFQITIKKDNGELKIVSTKLFKQGDENNPVDIAEFTNTYNRNENIYHMIAEKSLNSYGQKDLQDDEYKFVLKPIGTYASVAPMPKDTTGTGEDRELTVKNVGQRVLFEDATDDADGLVFLYEDDSTTGDKGLLTLLKPYFDNDPERIKAELRNDGIDFEYEMYEVIPTNATNNDNGTYTLYDETNHVTQIYDGIHHTRKITVKLVPDEEDSTKEVLDVDGHLDDYHGDYYIDKNGQSQLVSNISGYSHDKYHMTDDGAPIFRNEYIVDSGSIEVKKTWTDFDQSKRTEIEFELYKQGKNDTAPVKVTKDALNKDVTTKSITTKQDGSVTFENLPIYDEDVKIKYSIKELGVDDSYTTIIDPEEVTIDKDTTSTINVRNVSPKESVEKTVKQTIHYVSNKGKTIYEDYTASARFVASPRLKMNGSKPALDSSGNPIFEWYDEENTKLGEDSGDGSGINWSNSNLRKLLNAVNTRDKDHYSYDIETINEKQVGPTDDDIEETVVYIPDNYKIYFDNNGGEGNMPPQEMTWDELEALDMNKFKRNGYEFAGWNTMKDGSGESLTDKQQVINFLKDNKEITLYAQWKEVKKTTPNRIVPNTGAK